MMDDSQFKDLSQEERDWIDAYVDGTIEPDAFEALQDRMVESPVFRAVMRRYLAIDGALQNESAEAGAERSWLQHEETSSETKEETGKIIPFPRIASLAAAAVVAFFLGIGLMYWNAGREEGLTSGAERKEAVAEGFAVVGKLFDVVWENSERSFREGDTLGAENFRLASGTVEIQFFSGARMTVEGPADILLKSAWEASCQEGAVRMQVPPAARGFKLVAPSAEIVDLGTEFGLVIRDGDGHVEVLDGEIALTRKGEEEKFLKKGGALRMAEGKSSELVEGGQMTFPDVGQFGTRADDEEQRDFERWQAHRDALAKDGRLIAYYTFDREASGPHVPNLTLPRDPELDGTAILAESVDGRWPGRKSALEFRRPGARVRVNIPGEFPAFTFAAWVRIDSLDRRYNALFLGDGYETGEPHWQIRDDGKMMLSVMVDDTRPNPYVPEDAGFHRVYFSEPMWDLSMSGQWLHLVSVFDPANRRVSHYVNGQRISRQEIVDDYFIDKLRIGNGEIGNWGLPFREEPTFAIRNLNGRMDEIAIFREALQDEEIADLYERSRSGGK